MLDRVRELASAPGSLLGRLLVRLAEIGGVERGTVLGAQAFTALIPYLVVASALVPRTENESFANPHRAIRAPGQRSGPDSR